jgi:hypothetical protein
LNINITADSHADHLDSDTMSLVLGMVTRKECSLKVGLPGFQIHEVTLPEGQTVASALRGPLTGEAPVSEAEVHYGTRGGRPNVSRLTNLPSTQDGRVTVLIGQEKDSPEGEWGLITAYGGPHAPQEPGDPYLAAEGLEDAVAFWAAHALSVDGSPEATVTEGHSWDLFAAPAAK